MNGREIEIKGRKKESSCCDAGIQILLKCSNVSLKVLKYFTPNTIG